MGLEALVGNIKFIKIKWYGKGIALLLILLLPLWFFSATLRNFRQNNCVLTQRIAWKLQTKAPILPFMTIESFISKKIITFICMKRAPTEFSEMGTTPSNGRSLITVRVISEVAPSPFLTVISHGPMAITDRYLCAI